VRFPVATGNGSASTGLHGARLPGRHRDFSNTAMWLVLSELNGARCQLAHRSRSGYSTLGFQDTANLDDGDLWPVSYALQKWSPVVEKKVVELVKAAVS
jgi:hypothetical protein